MLSAAIELCARGGRALGQGVRAGAQKGLRGGEWVLVSRNLPRADPGNGISGEGSECAQV